MSETKDILHFYRQLIQKGIQVPFFKPQTGTQLSTKCNWAQMFFFAISQEIILTETCLKYQFLIQIIHVNPRTNIMRKWN